MLARILKLVSYITKDTSNSNIRYINYLVCPSVYRGPEIRGSGLESRDLKTQIGTRVFFFFFFPPICPSPESRGPETQIRTRVFFFFRPFPAGCPRLIPGFLFIYLFIFLPFFGGMPKVNTRVFFFFFFLRPFPTGYSGLILGFIFFRH
jgi:hypothetical protein